MGNLFALGNNGGKPPFYDDPVKMWLKAVEYFESTKQKTGEKYQPTIEGLVFHLGFSTRKSLTDYEDKEEFVYVIRRMKTFVKACYERQLYGFSWAGAAFALKNIGKEDWKDEITEHQNQTVTNVTITEKKREY